MFEKRTRIITYYVDGTFECSVNTLIDILERIDCSTVYNGTIDCEIYDYLLNKKYISKSFDILTLTPAGVEFLNLLYNA